MYTISVVEAPTLEPEETRIARLGLSEAPSFSIDLTEAVTSKFYILSFPDKDRSIIAREGQFWHIYTIAGAYTPVDPVDKRLLGDIIRMHEKHPYWGGNFTEQQVRVEIENRKRRINDLKPAGFVPLSEVNDLKVLLQDSKKKQR